MLEVGLVTQTLLTLLTCTGRSLEPAIQPHIFARWKPGPGAVEDSHTEYVVRSNFVLVSIGGAYYVSSPNSQPVVDITATLSHCCATSLSAGIRYLYSVPQVRNS